MRTTIAALALALTLVMTAGAAPARAADRAAPADPATTPMTMAQAWDYYLDVMCPTAGRIREYNSARPVDLRDARRWSRIIARAFERAAGRIGEGRLWPAEIPRKMVNKLTRSWGKASYAFFQASRANNIGSWKRLTRTATKKTRPAVRRSVKFLGTLGYPGYDSVSEACGME